MANGDTSSMEIISTLLNGSDIQGIRIVQPGKRKGEILIHYAEDTREYKGAKDTIVRPTYSRITDLEN